MNRLDKALEGMTKSMRGLEIGPSYNPVAPKRDGWNIHVIDHASQQDLRKKYTPMQVNTDAIEAVDFVCADNDFLKAVPTEFHGTYDYILSSHMIEHTTDLIRFLNQMEVLLAPGGVLSLIVPDKRYCFDFFRPLTSTADVLYAYHQKRQAHSLRTAFEHVAYLAHYKGEMIWAEAATCAPEYFRLHHTLADAAQLFATLSDDPNSEYRDYHNWKFTPASFRLVVLELQMMGNIGLSASRFHPSLNGEFFLHLVKKPLALPAMASKEAQAMRLKLLCEIQQEMVEMYLPAPEHAAVAQAPPTPKPSPLIGLATHIKRATPAFLRPLLGWCWRKLRSA